ncbi:MAG: DUF4012 domain-containing protein [Ktedonobacterales bacterium]
MGNNWIEEQDTAIRPAEQPNAASEHVPTLTSTPTAQDAWHEPPSGGPASKPEPSPHPKRRRRLIVALALLALLVAVLAPSALAVSAAMHDYSTLKTLGLSGVRHLLRAKNDLEGKPNTDTASSDSSCATTPSPTTTPGASTGTSSTSGLSAGSITIPDAAAVQAAQGELTAAQHDFQQIQTQLAHPDFVLSVAPSVPGVNTKISTARGLANIGYDASTLGIEITGAALPLLTRLHGSSLGNTSLLTKADVDALQHAIDSSKTTLADIQTQLKQVRLDDLPICAAQKDQFSALAAQLPRAQQLLDDASGLPAAAGWLLGTDAPRHFLIQTLDRTELRPTGGFAGEYGVVTVQNGKLQTLTLNNVDLIDYGHYSNGWAINNRPPDTYSWWPIPNWGLRDANLSADFPTNAKLVMDVFKKEGGGNVDGLINVTPVAIAHVLKVTGPLVVPVYNETVTADNLEDRIHYYQLTPEGIARNHALFPNDTDAFARKRFAQAIARLLEDRLRHLSAKELVPVAKQMLSDMRSKEIQVYVTNSKLEDLLVKERAAGAIDTTPGVDSFLIVHTNWSAAKSTPHIKVMERDDVTLDAKGGATHHLTMTMQNIPGNTPYYGFTTYQDYVRVYVPSQAKLLSADGFDTNVALCGGSSCSANPYPGGELVCPPGGYAPGSRTWTIHGNDNARPLDVLGGPTQTKSDVAGRAMWGGNIVVPMSCTATLTVSWYVANVAAPSTAVPAADAPYTLLVQRQAGTFYPIHVTIHPAKDVPADGTKTATFDGTLSENLPFTLGKPSPKPTP